MGETMEPNSIYPIEDSVSLLGNINLLEVYNKEFETLSNPGRDRYLMITDASKEILRGRKYRKSNHRLVIDDKLRIYWWPAWLRLTNASGIINSIASNYSVGYTTSKKLNTDLRKITIDFIASQAGRGIKEISLFSIFRELRDYLIKNRYDKSELSPSRFQIISSPDWSFRMIICDEPRIDFLKVQIPKQSIRKNVHPYPSEWLIQSFYEMDIPKKYVSTGDRYPRLLDVFQSGNFERIRDLISGEIRIVTKLLKQIGFEEDIVDMMKHEHKCGIFLRTLGFEPRREFYSKHFERTCIEKNLEIPDMYKILEKRCSEVLSAWINSYIQILGLNNEAEYLELLNDGLKEKYEKGFELGNFIRFMNTHKGQLRKNGVYSTQLRSIIPNEFLNLSEDAQKMLIVLKEHRNKTSHAPKPRSEEEMARIMNIAKRIGWESPFQTWTEADTRGRISKFFGEMYSVSDKQTIPRVPTLMKVTSIEDGILGYKAVLTCQRNGVQNRISLNKKREIQYYNNEGLLVQNSRTKPIHVGMRMYVLPTTNPIIVAPVITHV